MVNLLSAQVNLIHGEFNCDANVGEQRFGVDGGYDVDRRQVSTDHPHPRRRSKAFRRTADLPANGKNIFLKYRFI